MWGISIIADFRPMWYISFHAALFFGLGKDFLFKSALGHCALDFSKIDFLITL